MTRALPLMLLFIGGCVAPRVRIPGPLRPPQVITIAHAPSEPDQPVIAVPAVDDADAVVGSGEEGGDADTTAGRSTAARHGDPALARAAARYVGKSTVRVHGERYRADCSGFVAAVYAQTDRSLSGSSADLYARAKQAGVLHRRNTPDIGDLAFFDNTYDRNGNGRRDDPLSHVAIVEAIADDGTIILVHYGSKGVARFTMDLRRPKVHVDDDGILRNSYLRRGSGGDRTAGALFRGFGSLWKVGAES